MGSNGTIYYSYLLRMWQVPTNGERTWRIQLENIQTGEKRGFTKLDELSIYLNTLTEDRNVKMDEGNQREVQD